MLSEPLLNQEKLHLTVIAMCDCMLAVRTFCHHDHTMGIVIFAPQFLPIYLWQGLAYEIPMEKGWDDVQ